MEEAADDSGVSDVTVTFRGTLVAWPQGRLQEDWSDCCEQLEWPCTHYTLCHLLMSL